MDNHQRKETFDEVLSRISEKELREYYKQHTWKQVKEFFNVGETNLRHLMKFFSITKSQEERNYCIQEVWKQKPTSKENVLLNLKESVSKEDLVDFYIFQNNSAEETAKHFNLTNRELFKLIREYDCYKPHSLSSVITKNTKKAKYQDENFNNREKSKETLLKKYGVSNPSQLPDFQEKAEKTWHEHGFNHPMQCESIKQKQRDTMVANFFSHGGSGHNGINSTPNNIFNESLLSVGFSFVVKEPQTNEYTRELKLSNYFYDFLVNNTLVEINPSVTHNSTWSPYGNQEGIDKKYHFNKTKTAIENGYRCIHVWDWDDANKIITLLKNKETIYARQCEIKEVSSAETKIFIEANHLQGYAKSKINIGLYYNDILVSIMTFDKPRYNKKCEWELVRYCSSYNIIGGAEKIFKYFKDTYTPTSIVSYCDLSKFTGKTYEKLSFTLKNVSISRHWYNIKTGVHITDNLLRQRGFDQLLGNEYGFFGKGVSNNELMLMAGFVEIYDAGQATYIWQ